MELVLHYPAMAHFSTPNPSLPDSDPNNGATREKQILFRQR
jgi:hypothetical protein